MDVAEAKEAKKQLVRDLRKRINRFQKEAGMKVTWVDIDQIYKGTKESGEDVYAAVVDVEVEL